LVSLGRFSNSENWNYDYTLVQSSGLVEREPEYDEDDNDDEY